MEIETLVRICSENSLNVDPIDAELLWQYSTLLAGWNSRINLISRKDEAHILDRHILHSLVLAFPAICDYDFRNKRALDIGTGGGLPGIPLKVVTPSLDIMLVDSTQKKIAAVNEMIAQLKLIGIRAIAARVEDLSKSLEHAIAYNVIVSRAVAPLEDLIKWSRGLLKPGGVLFSLKGGDLSEEIQRANRAKGIVSIKARPLDLIGYPDFASEEKKLVRVDFAG